jgi:hypothetical protein
MGSVLGWASVIRAETPVPEIKTRKDPASEYRECTVSAAVVPAWIATGSRLITIGYAVSAADGDGNASKAIATSAKPAKDRRELIDN